MKNLIATRFDKKIEEGSSTKPWIVFTINADELKDDEETPYVVKLFSKRNVEQQPCIAKEFICNFLAKEFDLFSPEVGLINLHKKDFIKTLNNSIKKELSLKFNGLTFASKLHDGVIVNPKISLGQNFEMMARIYSFDCLILNSDRWGERKKPNLMICNQEFMLIDHELTLPFIDSNQRSTLDIIFKKINNKKFIHQHGTHLFHKNLKQYSGNKSDLFNTFTEYLKFINIREIVTLINSLKVNNINVGNSKLLIEYLEKIKNNSENFRQILIESIV